MHGKSVLTSALNYGAVRYESFGAPRNTGAVKDPLVQLGSGSDAGSRFAGSPVAGSSSETLYDPDRNNWGGRFGFAYNPRHAGDIVVRGGYGIFYDRPFDNLWQNVRNNSFVVPLAFTVTANRTDILAPAAAELAQFSGQNVSTRFTVPT